MNKSVESEQTCLVPDLIGNAFIQFFTIEDDVGCGFVIYGLYYVEESSLYAYFLEGFIINGC